MLTSTSEKRLNDVHPELARRVRTAIAQLNQQGHNVQIVQGLRTFDEQAALYAQGRTKPGAIITNAKAGFSNHNFGLAVDLCPYVSDGRSNWKAPDATWKAIGKAAEAQGLEWGGRWKTIVDRPHVQLPGLSVAQCRKLYQQGGLPAVWSAATRAIQAVEADAPSSQPAPARPVASAPTQIVRPAPTVTVTTNNATASSTALSAAANAPGVVQVAPPARPTLWGKLNTLGTFRAVQLLTGGTLGSAAFLLQYKWPLISVGALLLGIVIGWQINRPQERKTP